ncbi:hypothetical protein [Bartonella sp. CL63NXGY]
MRINTILRDTMLRSMH